MWTAGKAPGTDTLTRLAQTRPGVVIPWRAPEKGLIGSAERGLGLIANRKTHLTDATFLLGRRCMNSP